MYTVARRLDKRGASVVIPPKANRKTEAAFNKEVYKWRYLVENFFVTIHEFRGIVTRYEKPMKALKPIGF